MRTAAGARIETEGVSAGVSAARAARAGRRVGKLPAWARVPAIGAFVAVGLCLALSRAAGLPLDDAWIHQDFARTLATTGRFAFQPGHGAAGETSPIWVLVLLPPFLLTHGQPPVWLLVGWAGAVGTVVLAGVGIVTGAAAAAVARRAGAGTRPASVAAGLAGLAAVSEWHLVWAATSGMETNLFALLAISLILAAGYGLRPAWLGLLAAAAILARPEGLVVSALVVVAAAWEAGHQGAETPSPGVDPVDTSPAVDLLNAHAGTIARGREYRHARARLRTWGLSWLGPFLVALCVGLIPYFLLNLVAGGEILPSTVTAKTAEFQQGGGLIPQVAYYLAAVVGLRLLLASPMLLVLSALAGVWRLRCWSRGADGTAASTSGGQGGRHDAGSTFPLAALLALWPAALLLVYAGHLGAEYQHNRYLIPALPPLLALFAAGAAALLLGHATRLLGAVGGLLVAVSGIFSLGHAVQLGAADVQTVNCVQVETGRWLSNHTPQGALVATHDVGAIGYFSGRPLVDITGLVDPEVVPDAHAEVALRAYLARRHVAYLAIYSNWFPPSSPMMRELASGAIYQACGGRPMYDADGARYLTIYRTGWGEATRAHSAFAK